MRALPPSPLCLQHCFILSLPIFQWCLWVPPSGIFLLALEAGCLYVVKRREKSSAMSSMYSGKLSSDYFHYDSLHLRFGYFWILFQFKSVIQMRGLICMPHFITTLLQHRSFYSHTYTHGGSFIMSLFSVTLKSNDI